MQAVNSAQKPHLPPVGLFHFGFFEMANSKNISLISAEIKNEAAERHLDIVTVINTVDDELNKITNKLKQLEERVDILEHE